MRRGCSSLVQSVGLQSSGARRLPREIRLILQIRGVEYLAHGVPCPLHQVFDVIRAEPLGGNGWQRRYENAPFNNVMFFFYVTDTIDF